MKKKALAMVLSMAMVAGALAGCGSSEPATESKAPASSEAKTESSAPAENAGEEAPAEESFEGVEVKWLGYYTSALNIAENSWGEQQLREATGIDITGVSTINSENKDTYIASGEILDVTCYCNYIMGDYQFMWEQGLIREFPEEWLYEYYPTGMKYFHEWLGDDYFEQKNHLQTLDGEKKCINTPWVEGKTFGNSCVLYRKDWADNLGIAEPKTLQEFYDMCVAFTFDDPDGNGKDDTYAMDPIASRFGVYPVLCALGVPSPKGYWHNEDGSVIYQAATDEYKQALTIIKDWYDAGIIDPEVLTDDRSMQRQKWANGTLGVLFEAETWYYSERGASSVLALVEDVFGEGTVDILDPITSEYDGQTLGDGTVYATNGFPNTRGHGSLYFTKDATDEQVKAVLTILETLTTDRELQTKIMFGEEGTDYTMNGETLIVNPEMTVEDQAKKGIYWSFFGYAITDDVMTNISRSPRDLENMATNQSWPWKYTQNFAIGTTEAASLYAAEVNKVADEYYSNVLLGADSLDNWDAYVAKLDAAGLQEILKSYEEVLNK